MRAGELNEPVGFLVSSQYDLVQVQIIILGKFKNYWSILSTKNLIIERGFVKL